MSSNLPHDFEDNPAGLAEYEKWVVLNKVNEEVK